MREVLFVQGAGSDVHDEWDIRLVESLQRELGPGYDIRYPRMPNEDDPALATWQPAIETELASLRNGAIVIGHSVGGTLLINVLAASSALPALGAIVLISAPFIGEGGWTTDDLTSRPDLFDRLSPTVPLFLYHGEADAEVPVTHVELYSRAVRGAQVRRLAGRDHQVNNDLSEIARDILELESRAPRQEAARS